MKSSLLVAFGASLAAALLPLLPAQEQQMPPEMAAAFEKVKAILEPGALHQKLADYLGDWDVETSISMAPGQPPMKSKSKAKFSWRIEGRFLQQELKGQLMGKPYEGFGLIGHDNFKQAFVSTWVDNFNTYKLDSEGRLGQDGKTLIFYGTLDEYLTGENDKPVKYVYRWKSADQFSFEIHDLAIGEANTCVVTMDYRRAK
ncbi:MAG: DUF1579 domain-containing protein [Planctomycetes bacterium]|nr:DUF1579 domain-containing protein [Planctomycetota bacterium]